MIKQVIKLIVIDIYWVFVKLFGSGAQKRRLAQLRALFETDLDVLGKIHENFVNTFCECAAEVDKKIREKFLKGESVGKLNFPLYEDVYREKYVKYLSELYGGGLRGLERAQKALENELEKLKLKQKIISIKFSKRDTNNK